ncbi:MAG: sensor histidine kinase [Paenibacillaceae bacterium]|jgi:sensor histidine kinase YesM|nr:sensor histidine kinase [Paenibacillaceae bacterium]
MNRRISFQTRLFVIFSLLVILIIASAFSVFYWYYQKVNVETLVQTYQREAAGLSQQLDNSVYMMDRLLMQIKYNPTISNTLYYIPYQPEAEKYFENNPEAANQLKEVVSSIVGVDPQFYYRVSLISKAGAFLSMGAYYDRQLAMDRSRQLDWFARLSDQSEYRLLLPPHKDDWDHTGNHVVSVIRKIGDSANVYALAEIQIPYASIEKAAAAGAAPGRDKKIIILGRDGELVYPLHNGEEDSGLAGYVSSLSRLGREENGYGYMRLQGGRQELTVHHRGRYTDWTVIIAQPQQAFLEPTRKAGYLFAGLALLIVTLTVLTLYFSTKKLVKPLRQLRDTMNTVNLDSMQDAQERHLFAGAELNNSHNELHHLYHSFRRMLERLEDSKDQAIEARSRELKSHFVALQAQINPHFLYNTLSLIGVLGHETGNENIMNLTSMLASMFRYITYSNGQPVTLREELRHTSNYLNIMKIRYEDHLLFEIEVEEEVLESAMPKITLQPFVENCFKHGFVNKKHPWTVKIRGYEQEGKIIVEIADDGAGFPESFLERFRRQAAYAGNIKMMTNPDGEQGGSGVINTYTRLYYYFEERLQFELFNHDGGGAVVRVGWQKETGSRGGEGHAESTGGG